MEGQTKKETSCRL